MKAKHISSNGNDEQGVIDDAQVEVDEADCPSKEQTFSKDDVFHLLQN